VSDEVPPTVSDEVPPALSDEVTADGSEPPTEGSPRRSPLAIARIVLAVVVLVAVVLALFQTWDDVSTSLTAVSPAALVACVLLGLGPPACTMLGWRAVLRDLGSPLPIPPAAGIFFVGQLGKYLPGSVWSVVAQAEMGARLHVPRRRSAVVGILSIGLAVLTGLPARSAGALPRLVDRDAAPSRGGGSRSPSVSGPCCCGRGCSTPPSPGACDCCGENPSSTSCRGARSP
jgi:hypothetical protein